MMNERFIYLCEKFFESSATVDEKKELNRLIEENPVLKQEFEEQKSIKEELGKMKLKERPAEFWDGYSQNIYNRLERGAAWLLILIGAVILGGCALYQVFNELVADTNIPVFLKFGIFILFTGVIILIFSVLREKLSTFKNDKYKEIKR